MRLKLIDAKNIVLMPFLMCVDSRQWFLIISYICVTYCLKHNFNYYSNSKKYIYVLSQVDPLFFENSANHQQQPPFLLIGCSDSRVPPDQLTQTDPGDIFVCLRYICVRNSIWVYNWNTSSATKYFIITQPHNLSCHILSDFSQCQ